MRILRSLFVSGSVILCQAVSVHANTPEFLGGKAYQFSIGGDYALTSPLELVFDIASYDEGFAASLLEADQPYTYANGIVTTDGGDEVRLTFTSATSGTYEYWESDYGEFELDEVGTFSQVEPSLGQKSDWQHSETMDSALSSDYWNVWRRSVDSLGYNDGELNFLFANDGDPSGYDYPELELEYGRTLPMDADWQVVLDDIYVSDSVGQFDIELDLEVAGTEFECELGFDDYGSGREVSVYILNDSGSGLTSVSADDDAASAYSLNLRVVHLASSRELVFEYQPDAASVWTELARLNLGNGAFSGANASGEDFSGELVSATQRMVLDVQVQASQATRLSDLEIGGIEIGSYTPPSTPIDSDGDGLDDSAETNTGVYVSASDTGTNPNQSDTSGDGISDGEAVAAGVDPNTSYSGLLALVLAEPERFAADVLELRIGAEIAAVSNEAALLQIVLEESADLSTWSERDIIDVEVPLQAGETSKFFRYAMKGGAQSSTFPVPADAD